MGVGFEGSWGWVVMGGEGVAFIEDAVSVFEEDSVGVFEEDSTDTTGE